jgi:hypothetical protein
MRPNRVRGTLLLIFLTAPALCHAAVEESPLSRFSAEQKQKLLAGEVIYEFVKTSAADEAGRGHGQAIVLINAPIDRCTGIFRELDKQHEYFPRKTKSEVIKRQGNRTWLKNEFYFYISRVEYTSRYTVSEGGRRFDFEMDKAYPHSIPESAGYFLFEKIDDNRTLFTYAATRLDTGASVPAFIQEFITSRDLPAQAVNVKKRIESGGKWIK